MDDRTRPRGQDRAQPPDAARRRTTRASATSSSSPAAGFLEGLHRGKPGVDMELLARHAEGVIASPGCLALALAAAGSSRAGCDEARAHLDELVQVFGPEDVYFEIQHNGIAEQDAGQRGDRPLRARRWAARWSATADVHYLRREDYHHHAALLCVQTKSTLAAPKMSFDTNEFYLKSSQEMAESFAATPEALAVHAGDRRALRRRDRARQAADPALRLPGRQGREGLPARARARGPARALRRPAARRGDRAHGDGARRHRQDGLQRLLPDRLGLRRLREVQRHRRRPGPRLGRRQPRRLLPADHRRGPAALRPAVRALPQRRARVDAGHRHRLLRARPRARDPLRDREVRHRAGRADHHLRQDVPARGHARRGARARPRVRDRRQAREADPGPAAGPPAELRGLPAARRRPRRRGGARPGRQADRGRRAGPRGDRPQRVDPRRRGRDRRPAADRHRAAAARRRRQRARTARRSTARSRSTR